MKIPESPEFSQVKTEQRPSRMPGAEVVRRYPGKILTAIGIHVGDTTLGFVTGIFILGFATTVLHFSPTTTLLALIAGSAANLAWTPVAGHLADRHGARSILALGAVAMGVWAFPMFWLIDTGSVAALFVAMVISQLIVATLFAPQSSFFASLFPATVRYSGASIGFQVATVLGGGLAPLIAQALQNSAGATWPVSIYLIVIAVLALLATVVVRPLGHRKPPAETPTTNAGDSLYTVDS